jgi:hypothetical protein
MIDVVPRKGRNIPSASPFPVFRVLRGDFDGYNHLRPCQLLEFLLSFHVGFATILLSRGYQPPRSPSLNGW